MPRNTALHNRAFTATPAAAGGTAPAAAARSSTGSNVSAQSTTLSTSSGASIATTPANQLLPASGFGGLGRASSGSNSSSVGVGAAPSKLLAGKLGSGTAASTNIVIGGTPLDLSSHTPGGSSAAAAAGGGVAPSLTALDSRMMASCHTDIGATTPWPNRNTAASAQGGAGKTLNFSAMAESPCGTVDTSAAMAQVGARGGPTTVVCHCPNCNIQVVACMQCTAPMIPGPLAGGGVGVYSLAPPLPQEPLKPQTGFALFKEEQLKKESKGTPTKLRVQNAARLWSAASASEKQEYNDKAKQMHQAAVAAQNAAQNSSSFPGGNNMLSVGRGKRGRDSFGTGAPEKEKVKRPPSSYMNFLAAKRSEVSSTLKATNPDKLEGSELAKWVFKESAGRLSGMWKELSEDEKSSYKLPASASASATASAVGDNSVAPSVAEDEEEDGPVIPGEDAAPAQLPSAAADNGASDEEADEAPVTKDDDDNVPAPKDDDDGGDSEKKEDDEDEENEAAEGDDDASAGDVIEEDDVPA